MKRLALIMLVATSVAHAGTMHNGTWYGVGVPSRHDVEQNNLSYLFNSQPVYSAPVVQTRYYYPNPAPVAPPVTMPDPEPIIHSATMNGEYKGRPQDVFLAECMRYGYNQKQCMDIWNR